MCPAYVDVVRQVLARTDTVKMLVTSRAALDLREEWNFRWRAELSPAPGRCRPGPRCSVRMQSRSLPHGRAGSVPISIWRRNCRTCCASANSWTGCPEPRTGSHVKRTLPCAVIAQELARSYELLNVSALRHAAAAAPYIGRRIRGKLAGVWTRLNRPPSALSPAFHQTFFRPCGPGCERSFAGGPFRSGRQIAGSSPAVRALPAA